MGISDHRPLLWIDGQAFNYIRDIPRGTCRDCHQDRSGMDGYQGTAADAGAGAAAEVVTYCPECAEDRAAA